MNDSSNRLLLVCFSVFPKEPTMFAIAEDIDSFLRAKENWYFLIILNIVLFPTQPFLLSITVAGLLLLKGLSSLLHSLQNNGLWRLCKVVAKMTFLLLVFGCSFQLVVLGIEFFSDSPRTEATHVIGFFLACFLWGSIAILRHLRTRRRQLAESKVLQQAQEQTARKLAESQQHASMDQCRRENARSSCELLYSLHAAEIGQRYPRTEFDGFLKKYMSDSHEPAYVEERAEQLKRIIEQQRQKIEPAEKKKSLQDLARWYEATRQEIDDSPLPSRQKNVQLAQLSNRYQELVQEVLEEMTP